MLLKTFKGRILAVSLGMTIASVAIFGYGLASIYYQHMHKCLNRSLSFLTDIITHEYALSEWNSQLEQHIAQNDQVRNVLKGGLIQDFRIEMHSSEPHSSSDRLYRSVVLEDGRYFTISSSTEKIDEELLSMIGSRWGFFLIGFLLTIGLIYFLIRLLFAPFNQLVNHCLTCEDPDNKPEMVSGGREVIALRDAIATLQQRISGLQNAQRQTMKALTHELKTPLAQLRLRIDIADQKGEWKSDAIASSREEIDAISGKITLILHENERIVSLEKVLIRNALEKWIEEMTPLWEHRSLQFKLDIPNEAMMLLPRVPFERVARILIENALNHTAKGSTIVIRFQQGVLRIDNPLGGDQLPIIHSSGVGLEIAQTLCEYYGWQMSDTQDETHYGVTLVLIS
jgi:signal transduction histidine kinase